MPKLAEAAATVDAIKDRIAPALDTVDETLRQGRRVIVRAQHAAEDGLGAAVVQIRRHPLRTIALATGAGALAGCLVGFVFAQRKAC